MTLLLLLFLMSSALAVNQPAQNRATHPYEFVRTGTRKVNDIGPKASANQFGQVKPLVLKGRDKPSSKKVGGVPPYAVLMEPLVKYSQPDPLYDKSKEASVADETFKQVQVKKEENGEKSQSFASSKNSRVSSYEDSDVGATHLRLLHSHHRPPPPPPRPHHHHQVEYSAPGILYEGPIPEEPEPIIEIIIKESNQSLPTPPPLPLPPKKKKKENVQVFYVKYKKDPSSHYGEDKIIYDAPIPAITPPTNNANPAHEEEEEEFLHHHHHEEVTLPPKPSTTLKAIIKPDSEQYHGSGGIHITFGQPRPEENGGSSLQHHHHHHHRDDLEESAPQPSVLLPPDRKASETPKIGSESQITKRNPAPFRSQTPPPQQSFGGGAPSVSQPREFQRLSPLPTIQQTPRFPAQSFKPLPPKIHPSVAPTPSRPSSPTLQYSTVPQHLQQFPKPQGSFSFPPRPQLPPQQLIPQSSNQAQQFYSADQYRSKSNLQANVLPTPSQQYHTISNQAAQQHSFQKNQPRPPSPSSPTFHQAPNPFPQSSRPLPFPSPDSFSQTSNSFPQTNTFSQMPQQVIGPIIQRTQVPALPQPNAFSNGPALPPQPPQLAFNQQSRPQSHSQTQSQPVGRQQLQNSFPHPQQQHHQQVEQLNRLQQQQQRLQSQILDQQKQNYQNQQRFPTTYAPEVLRSVSPELPFSSHRFETKKPQFHPATRPPVQQTVRSNFAFSKNSVTTTESLKKYTQTTQPPVEYVTEDPKKAEEERRKKEEKKKQNVAALPKEVPDDLREQLLSSGILGNADIQILDYDKIGDIPIESLPPEALANFQAVAGSAPVPSVLRPDSEAEDAEAEASEQRPAIVPPDGPTAEEHMEMKLVRYDPDTKEGARVADKYVQRGATQLEPVVLNDSKYNRYLPLKVAGAQFPVPDVPELRGKNVTSVVVLAPVDYEFLQRHDDVVDDTRAGRRSSHPVLEVQGVRFVAGDVLKTLVKAPTTDNYKKWLEKENQTSLDKQSVVLLVIEPKNNATGEEKEIFMYDIGSRKVSKLSGELSAQFVEVAESNSENEDLEEISDVQGGDFTLKDAAEASGAHVRSRRKATSSAAVQTSSLTSSRPR